MNNYIQECLLLGTPGLNRLLNISAKLNTQISVSSTTVDSPPAYASNMTSNVTQFPDEEWRPYLRRWVARDPPVSTDPSHSFTVVTYNVLTDRAIREGQYLYCPEEVRYTSARHPRILREIEVMNPDVICLQEVSPHHYHQLMTPDMEKLGYGGLYNPREDECGLATFYKTDRFLFVAESHATCSDLMEKHLEVTTTTVVYTTTTIVVYTTTATVVYTTTAVGVSITSVKATTICYSNIQIILFLFPFHNSSNFS